ncbi:MAG: hypothetical protein LUD72_00920 [Bacteroidales bacterium]|nr:hypothetical protein [Bacteroidales bacterium]
MNDYDELASLVREMRAKQKEYFKTRDTNVLREAKALEAKVDKVVFPPVEEDRRQLNLFDGGNLI